MLLSLHLDLGFLVDFFSFWLVLVEIEMLMKKAVRHVVVEEEVRVAVVAGVVLLSLQET